MKQRTRLLLLLVGLCLFSSIVSAQAQWNGFLAQQTSQTPLALRISGGDNSSVLGTFQFLPTTVTLSPNATSYIYMDLNQSPPVLTVNTTGFPTTPIYEIAIAITNSATIISLQDVRPAFNKSAFAGGGGGGSSIQVNGGANLASPVNFQNATSAFNGLTLGFSNPNASNVQPTITGTFNLAGLTLGNANGDVVQMSGGVWADSVPGSTCRTVTTTTTIDPVADRLGCIRFNGTSLNQTIPSAATQGNGFAFKGENINSTNLILTPTTSTLNGLSSVTIGQNVWFSIQPDNTNTNYFGDFHDWIVCDGTTISCTPQSNGSIQISQLGSSGGVSSLTLDGTVLSGSSTTGDITESLISQQANTVLAGPSSGSAAAPTFRSLSASDVSPTSYVSGGGTAQAQTVTLTPAAASYTAGLTVRWLPIAANTGAGPTLNVNGLGAKTITKNGTTSLIANDLTTTAIASVVYDGTEFQLQNPQTSNAGVSEATLSWGTNTATLNSTSVICSATAPTVACVRVTFPNAHTLVRFNYTQSTAAGGCGTSAVIGVIDITASSNIYTVTISNGLSNGYVDSGALSTAMTAGHEFGLGLITASSGCSTNPVVGDLTMVYQ